MNVSIAGFRHQTRSDFSAVVRTQSGARSFANDPVLKTRHPHLAKVAQQTIRASSGNNGSNKPPVPALMRRSSTKVIQMEEKASYNPEKYVGWFFVALAAFFLLALYSGNTNAQTYPTSWGSATYQPSAEARRVQNVRYATVLDIRRVSLREEQHNYVASGVGGVLGGLLGSQVGKGNGTTAAQILLAAAGAYAGNKMVNATKDGLEVIVKMDDGKILSIVQEIDGTPFDKWQRVRVIGSEWGGATRVVPAPEAPMIEKREESKEEKGAAEMWKPTSQRIAAR